MSHPLLRTSQDVTALLVAGRPADEPAPRHFYEESRAGTLLALLAFLPGIAAAADVDHAS